MGAAVFGAGEEEDAVAEALPGIGFGAVVVTEEDGAETCEFGGGEDFGAFAESVGCVFGVDVEDGGEVAIDADRGELFADLLEGEAGGVDGGEAFGG